MKINRDGGSTRNDKKNLQYPSYYPMSIAQGIIQYFRPYHKYKNMSQGLKNALNHDMTLRKVIIEYLM